MDTQIFVRIRRKIEKGEKKPRFRVVGVSGAHLRLYAKHIRRQELDQIAAATGAKVIELTDAGDGSGPGTGSGRA
ncbi:MAG: hypothetical protein QNJ22_11840 [Desulfosarcinaceae bacterium]|nr:hypothetical protein [Desulfosarcinaceae bacterium]